MADVPASGHPLTTTVPLRPTDYDSFGHVHNTNYFDLMEVGRARWFAQGFWVSVVIARSECNHRREIPLGVESVDVTVRAESVSRSSFVLRHDLHVGGEPYADGRTVMVKIDEDGRPTPLTDEEKARLVGG